ncbi:MAG TPA: UDP-glucose 4-epimerase GalE [Blastocatellia bacterium]|jgi:UDP-glucose 4-epimerase|nr:UDP-glucose 4-epimerase GalE [Blastocatellia bacterium]
MKVLVSGGAGYIGSVVVEQLIKHGHEAVVYDNLSKGHAAAVSPEATFIKAGLLDRETLVLALDRNRIEAVIHLAASSLVGEAVENPHPYFINNVGAGLSLLDAMLTVGVKKLVFSSTAAVYGAPETMPITEEAPQNPTNPYGESKLAFERMLRWYDRAYRLRYVSLRYFNAAGASERFGEDHAPETHLIPNTLRVAAAGAGHVSVFGEDYNTPDGTCVRDYIHVIDLADAHVLALNALEKGSEIYNLGYGSGYSVAEVVEMARQVTSRWISTEAAPRRAGDPPVLIASPDKIMRDLGWNPRHSELDSIIESAWRWRLAHPNGYEE